MLADPRLLGRTGTALAVTNARYWITVAPTVTEQLQRWEQRAREIPDPTLRALAIERLRQVGQNAQATATLATLAPRRHRKRVTEAIIACQLLYDYLDVLTEQTSLVPETGSRQLFQALHDTLTPPTAYRPDYYRHSPFSGDGGYLEQLSQTAREALTTLPAAAATAEAARRTVARCSEAQLRLHTTITGDTSDLEGWARSGAKSTTLQWREFLAGAAASILTLHALIAASADSHTTPEQAAAIESLYLSIAALGTLLDSIIDRDEDITNTGRPGLTRHYNDDELEQALTTTVRRALIQARSTTNTGQHIVTLIGVAAFHLSEPSARSPRAVLLTKRLRRELQPLMGPTLAAVRIPRALKEGDPTSGGATHVPLPRTQTVTPRPARRVLRYPETSSDRPR